MLRKMEKEVERAKRHWPLPGDSSIRIEFHPSSFFQRHRSHMVACEDDMTNCRANRPT